MGLIRVNQVKDEDDNIVQPGRELSVIGPHWHPADQEEIRVTSNGVITYFVMTDQGHFETKILNQNNLPLVIKPGHIHKFDNPNDVIVDVEIKFNGELQPPSGVIEMTDVITNLGKVKVSPGVFLAG